jgi:hypothetical protein
LVESEEAFEGSFFAESFGFASLESESEDEAGFDAEPDLDAEGRLSVA